MMNDESKKILSWLAVLAWLAVIFGFSSIQGGAEHPFSWAFFFERKSLHVIEYFILCVLLYQAFSQDFILRKAVYFSMALALVYAASDEWHQTFVFGRDGNLRDVAIDAIGIFVALILILKFDLWKKNKK